MREAKDITLVDLVFPDAKPREVPVSIEGRSYVLVEATEEDVTLYENTGARGLKFSNRGKLSGVDRASDARAVLLAACLKEVRSDGTHGAVAEAFIRGLPSRITKPIFTVLKEMSGIDDNREEEDPESERGLIEKIDDLQAQLDKLQSAKNGHVATPAITA